MFLFLFKAIDHLDLFHLFIVIYGVLPALPLFLIKKWFISFTDDHTRVCWVYLLCDKSKVAQIFENFNVMIQTQYNLKFKFLRTDNGTKYFNFTLSNFILKSGMVHQSSRVNTPQ